MIDLSRSFVYTVRLQRAERQSSARVPQPRPCNACRLSHMIGLASSGFARHYLRNRFCFLFLWVLRCFTSPRSLYPPYIFRRESTGPIAGPDGVSPFGDPRIEVWLPTPRGLSQAPTSFFGSWCQGIHRAPLLTCSQKDARVHCAVLKVRATTWTGVPRASAARMSYGDRRAGRVRLLGGPASAGDAKKP